MQRTATSRRGFLIGSGALLAMAAASGAVPRSARAASGGSALKDLVERLASEDDEAAASGDDSGAAPDNNPVSEARGGEVMLETLETIEFGTYPTTADGELAPIEWYVLAETDGRKLLFSKYVLDCAPYNEEYVNITWESCTLRAWLNDEFMQAAFSSEEQGRIAEVELNNPDNLDWGTPGCERTTDRVFALSLAELLRYLHVQSYYQSETLYEDLIAQPTALAVKNGALVDSGTAGSPWWLRSPGIDAVSAAYVDIDGDVRSGGGSVGLDYVGVRPALWLEADQ